MRKPTYQFFSLKEYGERLEALRQRMLDRGIDVILVTSPENICYLSGYQTPGYYWFQTLVVPLEQEPVLITRLIEASNIEPFSIIEDARPYEDHDDWIAHTQSVLADLGLNHKRIGIDFNSFFLRPRDFTQLQDALSSGTIVDAMGLVESGRVIKSAQEIEYIRHAARAAEAAVKAGIDACEAGVSENDVAAEMHRAQIRAGSEYTGLPIFIRAGARDAQCHAAWYRKVLEPGESITMEVPGCINRYHAALYGQVFLGDPPDALVTGMEISNTILQESKDAIRPGVAAGDIHELVQSRLSALAGQKSKRASRTAYSIGLAFAPDWGEGEILSMMHGEKRELRAGMTFHLLAGFVTLHGMPKIRRSCATDTILVTNEGCETLTSGVEHKLYVK